MPVGRARPSSAPGRDPFLVEFGYHWVEIETGMKMKPIVVVVAFLFGGLSSCKSPRGLDDVYVDRLVYLKSDSSLFTGALRISDRASTGEINFCDGLPCGEWGEYQNGGGIIQEGEILDPSTLSKTTQDLLSPDTFSIDHWSEGKSPTVPYPTYLTIDILKDDAFFQSDKKQYDDDLVQLANAVCNDTRHLKYDYLRVRFVDAVFDWHQYYSKEYKLEGGKLVETQ
jgi:hypothetical protein